MCFIYDNHKLRKAIKDIVVYKDCYNCIKQGNPLAPEKACSEYQNYIYEVNEQNPKIKLIVLDRAINEGYHSYKRKGMGNTKFIIPKGTRYYYNESYEEYVSSQIIFKGWL